MPVSFSQISILAPLNLNISQQNSSVSLSKHQHFKLRSWHFCYPPKVCAQNFKATQNLQNIKNRRYSTSNESATDVQILKEKNLLKGFFRRSSLVCFLRRSSLVFSCFSASAFLRFFALIRILHSGLKIPLMSLGVSRSRIHFWKTWPLWRNGNRQGV